MTTQPELLIGAEALEKHLQSRSFDVNRVTLWRMRKRGEFPEPVRLSPGKLAWPTAVVDQWLDDRIEAGRACA